MDSFKQVGTDDTIVNLGNLYDEIGRPLEAIVTYEKVTARTPGFGMAIGNKALAVENLAPISEYQAAYLVYAHQLYEQALSHKESVIEHGGVHSLHDFTSRRNNIAAHLKHTGHEDWLERDLAHDAFNAEDYLEDEASYVQFCLENDLISTSTSSIGSPQPASATSSRLDLSAGSGMTQKTRALKKCSCGSMKSRSRTQPVGTYYGNPSKEPQRLQASANRLCS